MIDKELIFIIYGVLKKSRWGENTTWKNMQNTQTRIVLWIKFFNSYVKT
jgi:hypothetical protein